MTLDPRTRDEVYSSLRSNLTGRIEKLTNFAENTFNWVWTQAFAQELHNQEVAATAVQLSGWADFVGKEVTEDDLEDLGIDGATAEEINQFVADGHLDEFAKAFGVSRDPGTRATGTLEITTSEGATVPQRTEFGTQPDSNGNYLSFFTAEEVSTDSANTVEVTIEAGDVGNEFNVGSNTVTYMPNPPAGVDSVTNPDSISGGKGEQTNEELRQDVKNAVVESTEGGTTDGVSGYITGNTGASDAIVDEQFEGDAEHGNYPHADVFVLGGTDQEVQDAIDFAHPSGVEHILERPTAYNINIEGDVEGSDVDTSEVEQEISEYFNSLLLGEDVYRDKLIQIIMNADEDVLNISTLSLEIDSEPHTYEDKDGDGTPESSYLLDKGSYMESDGVQHVYDNSGDEYVEGTDYDESAGSLNWLDGGSTPDEGEEFYVTYSLAEDVPITDREVAQLNDANITVV